MATALATSSCTVDLIVSRIASKDVRGRLAGGCGLVDWTWLKLKPDGPPPTGGGEVAGNIVVECGGNEGDEVSGGPSDATDRVGHVKGGHVGGDTPGDGSPGGAIDRLGRVEGGRNGGAIGGDSGQLSGGIAAGRDTGGG